MRIQKTGRKIFCRIPAKHVKFSVFVWSPEIFLSVYVVEQSSERLHLHDFPQSLQMEKIARTHARLKYARANSLQSVLTLLSIVVQTQKISPCYSLSRQVRLTLWSIRTRNTFRHISGLSFRDNHGFPAVFEILSISRGKF